MTSILTTSTGTAGTICLAERTATLVPDSQNLRELGYLVELDMSPMAAVVAGTRTAAELLGIADQVGTLETGKQADLVVTDVDPLTNIEQLGDPASIAVVMLAGVVVKDLPGLALE